MFPNTRIEIFGLSWIILHYDNGNSEQLLIACKDCNFLPSLIRSGLNVAHCREDGWWFRWSFLYQWFVDDFCLVLCCWIGFLHFFFCCTLQTLGIGLVVISLMNSKSANLLPFIIATWLHNTLNSKNPSFANESFNSLIFPFKYFRFWFFECYSG